MSSVVLEGKCYCGQVKYTAATLPIDVTNCHCRTCRKLSGGPFIAFAEFKTKDVRFYDNGEDVDLTNTSQGDAGALHVFSFSDQAIRAACRQCHAPLLMLYHNSPEIVSLTVGTIDESDLSAEALEKLKPSHHIFVGEKAPWYDTAKDGLPCYDGFSRPSNMV